MQSNADRAELGRQMREQFQSDAPDPGMLAPSNNGSKFPAA